MTLNIPVKIVLKTLLLSTAVVLFAFVARNGGSTRRAWLAGLLVPALVSYGCEFTQQAGHVQIQLHATIFANRARHIEWLRRLGRARFEQALARGQGQHHLFQSQKGGGKLHFGSTLPPTNAIFSF